MRSCVAGVCILAATALFAGCGAAKTEEKSKSRPTDGDGGGGYGANIFFVDDAESNASPDVELQDLTFVDQDGEETRIGDLAGEKNLVVVVTRGYPGEICPICSTQVARLMDGYEEIKKLNAEVVVVYPVETNDDSKTLDDFVAEVKKKVVAEDSPDRVPFPVLLDAELKGVDKLGIRKDLSKPATYVVDTAGEIRFAYVGKTRSDRPSMLAIIKQLEKLKPAN